MFNYKRLSLISNHTFHVIFKQSKHVMWVSSQAAWELTHMTCTRDCAMYCHVTKMADAGSSSPRDELSESEAEQYDRQIRLWGLDAQKR